MNIGKYRNVVTVQQLYDYALQHNYLGADVNVVLDIINKERVINEKSSETIIKSSNRDFSKIVEYSYEDLIALLT